MPFALQNGLEIARFLVMSDDTSLLEYTKLDAKDELDEVRGLASIPSRFT